MQPLSVGNLNIPPVTEPYDFTSSQFEEFMHTIEAIASNDRDKLVARLKNESLADARRYPFYMALGTASLILKAHSQAATLHNYLSSSRQTAKIYVIQPVYNEAERMSPRTADNPYGENALLYRAERLAALSQLYPTIHFHIIVVDDGCDGKGNPNAKSAVVAQRLLKQAPKTITAEVVELDNLIRDASTFDWIPGITTAQESRKGGSVIGGFAYARSLARMEVGSSIRHAFVDVDADLSIHPDQTILVAAPVIEGRVAAAIASRRVDGAVACIDTARDMRGKDFIRQWQSLLPVLATQVTDVNRGMKAFSLNAINTLIENVQDKTFTYQIESLHALAVQGLPIQEVPVSYIDSVALSTQTGDAPAQTYDDQLARIHNLSRRIQ